MRHGKVGPHRDLVISLGKDRNGRVRTGNVDVRLCNGNCILNPSTNVKGALCRKLSCLRCCDRFPSRGAIYMSNVSSCPIVGDGRSFGLHTLCPTTNRQLPCRPVSCDRICFHRPRAFTSRAHLGKVIGINSSTNCCVSVFHDQGMRNNSGVRSCFCRGLKRRVALATTSNDRLKLRPARRLTFTKTRLCTCSCVCGGGQTIADGSIGTKFAVRVPSGSSVAVGL